MRKMQPREADQIKNGRTKAGSQRYSCKYCGKTYTPVKKERMYPEELKDRAIELYMGGNSGRTVGRLGCVLEGLTNKKEREMIRQKVCIEVKI